MHQQNIFAIFAPKTLPLHEDKQWGEKGSSNFNLDKRREIVSSFCKQGRNRCASYKGNSSNSKEKREAFQTCRNEELLFCSELPFFFFSFLSNYTNYFNFKNVRNSQAKYFSFCYLFYPLNNIQKMFGTYELDHRW